MNTIEITVLVGIIGALGTILGIFHNRDKKASLKARSRQNLTPLQAIRAEYARI